MLTNEKKFEYNDTNTEMPLQKKYKFDGSYRIEFTSEKSGNELGITILFSFKYFPRRLLKCFFFFFNFLLTMSDVTDKLALKANNFYYEK